MPVAYHFQLRELLRDTIARGEFPPDTQLPSEHELCRRYQVSRTTVRNALQALVQDGLIYAVRGKGTFVTHRKILEGLAANLSFFDDMRQRGIAVTTKVLACRVEPASPSVASVLGLRPGDQVIRLARLRLVGRSPLLSVTSYLPEVLCSGLHAGQLEGRGLHEVLREDFNIIPSRAVRSFEAVPATARDAELLRVPLGAPIQYVESVVYDGDGMAVEYFMARHRGDRTKFAVEIMQRGETGTARGVPPGGDR